MAWLWVILALLYVISRIDLIPDFIVGWGWIDDIAVLIMLYRYLFRLRGKQTNRTGESQDRFRHQQRQSDATFEKPKSPYEILNVQPTADDSEIRSAYRKLANQYHPDKVAHLGKEFQELAEKRFKEIQDAYRRVSGAGNKNK
jgi:DnaJ-domain-containing protein 1